MTAVASLRRSSLPPRLGGHGRDSARDRRRRPLFARLTFELIIGAFIVIFAGCISGSTFDTSRTGSTRVTAATLGSATPPLPLLLVRLAESELSLSSEQATIVAGLNRQADKAAQPIDEARVVYLESLARSLDDNQLHAVTVSTAEERLARATEQMAPVFIGIVEELRRTLSPRQRALLVQEITSPMHFARWAPAWHPTSSRDYADERARAALWLSEFTRDDGRQLGRLMTDDLTAVTRTWAASARERAEATIASGDIGARRQLAIRMRTDRLPD